MNISRQFSRAHISLYEHYLINKLHTINLIEELKFVFCSLQNKELASKLHYVFLTILSISEFVDVLQELVLWCKLRKNSFKSLFQMILFPDIHHFVFLMNIFKSV